MEPFSLLKHDCTSEKFVLLVRSYAFVRWGGGAGSAFGICVKISAATLVV